MLKTQKFYNRELDTSLTTILDGTNIYFLANEIQQLLSELGLFDTLKKSSTIPFMEITLSDPDYIVNGLSERAAKINILERLTIPNNYDIFKVIPKKELLKILPKSSHIMNWIDYILTSLTQHELVRKYENALIKYEDIISTLHEQYEDAVAKKLKYKKLNEIGFLGNVGLSIGLFARYVADKVGDDTLGKNRMFKWLRRNGFIEYHNSKYHCIIHEDYNTLLTSIKYPNNSKLKLYVTETGLKVLLLKFVESEYPEQLADVLEYVEQSII